MCRLHTEKLKMYSGKRAIYLSMFMIGVLFTLASMSGCGGGGSGGGTPRPPATLTADNADEIAGAALQVFDLVGPISAVTGNEDFTVSAVSKVCPGGGTQELVSVGQIVENTRTILIRTFFNTNCVVDTKTVNGTETLQFDSFPNGQLNATENTEYIYDNYSYQDSANGDDLTFPNLRMLIVELVASSATLDDVTATLQRRVTGSAAGDTINNEFENFSITMKEVTGGDEYTLSGIFQAQCMDGWVEVSTDTPFFVPTGGGCPTAGSLTISSAGKTITVEISNNGNVSVAFEDDAPTVYVSCTDLKGICI